MRLHALFAATALAMAFALPARSADTAQQTAMKSCAASWSAMSAADKAKTKHQEYMSSCLKGGGKSQAAASSSSMSSSMSMSAKPAAAGSMQMAAPAGGGSAKCKDGTTVTYKHRQGTCSGHGGVASWM
jgi:hypothetical protein